MIIVLNKKVKDIEIPYTLSKTKHYVWNIKRRYR